MLGDVMHRTTMERRMGVNLDAYDPAEWLVDPALPGCPDRYWKVEGDLVIEMGEGERAAKDADLLDAAKFRRIDEIGEEVTAYIEGRYDKDRKLTMVTMLDEARDLGYTARRDYLLQVWSWVQTCMTSMYIAQGTVAQVETEEAVYAVAIDYASLTAADPLCSIYGAMILS